MGNRWKKWFAVVMATVLGMPGYGLVAEHIQTKAEDGSVTIHVESEERHVQINETISLIDGVSVEGPSENGETYRVVVRDVQEQDSGLSLYEEGMEEFSIPQEAAGKTYRVLYQAQSSMDSEAWNDVDGVEKEVLLVVDQEVNEEEQAEIEEETIEETEKTEEEKEEPKEAESKSVSITLQGQEREEAEIGEVFSFVHDNNVIMNIPEEDEKDYRIIVTGVDTPENGSYQYQEGDESFVPQKGDEGLTYVVHYGVDINKDDESHDNQWEQVEGVSFDKEVIVTDKVIIQGEKERIIPAENEYDFIKDSDLVVKGPKEEENSCRLKVKEVKSPENGSYTYHEGDESFTPKDSDEGLVYEVTYVAETSKDGTTWKEVEDVQFIQKLTVVVFRAEEVRGPLATEAILCTGQQFNNFVANWNSGSTIKVKNLVKADVPSDLISASLRYKYETISDPSSPVKIYMWHDMNAYGQYVDTVYFGTEVPGATIYTNPDASWMFYGSTLEKLYDSANPSTPYFFNTSKTTNFRGMFEDERGIAPHNIPFDCTNGNGVGPLGLIDTSNATSLSGMFSRTSNLDLSAIENWDVHKVTNISEIFYGLMNTKIPWGIGNWEFDNLQNVEDAFAIAQYNFHQELNFEKWDLSHCDASKMLPKKNESKIDRLGLGTKLVDKNGKVFFPKNVLQDRLQDAGSVNPVDNGTWENETTGEQYFQSYYDYNGDYINKFLGNSASTTEFSEMYLANPTGMRGIYKVGKGYYIRYQPSNDAPSTVKDESGSSRRAAFYKKTDTTAVLETNHFLWEYHDFQNWKEQFVSPHELKSPGDIVPLNRNYLFEGIWTAHERTITYDLDGGVNDPRNPTKFTPGGNEAKRFYDPTKSGMLFAGWTWTSASKSMSDPWFFRYANGGSVDEQWPHPSKAFPDENIVLKAHWASARTITIHGNGGKTFGYGQVADFPVELPDVNDIELRGLFQRSYVNLLFYLRGKKFGSIAFRYENYNPTGVKDSLGNDMFGEVDLSGGPFLKAPVSSGINDFYIQWVLTPKNIVIQFNPTVSSPHIDAIKVGYVAPDGSHKVVDNATANACFVPFFKEYTGKQWDETSPNVTISLKGHEIGATNEYVFDNYEDVLPGNDPRNSRGFLFQSFTISSPGSSHTYPTGNLTSYTFTGGFDKDVTITFNWVRAWRVQYVNLDDTPITTMQTLFTSDLPYTFRSTIPPHAPWHGFDVIPVGWTLGIYNQWPIDARGIYTNTGNLPTLYRGTWNATQFDTAESTLKLYPMYSVDVNKDGIPDLFQNKNTLTVSKEVVKGQYSDLTSLTNKVFPYEITFNDVHGDPIKNWSIQDTNGQTYTTDNSGKVTINLRHQESVSFKGMLPNMIVRAVETGTQGMIAEYAISYNGTSFTAGTDTGNVTYQDNTPLTFTFRNTDNRTIVPAGIKDTNTRVYVLLIAVLIALAFSIRMLKVRRRA